MPSPATPNHSGLPGLWAIRQNTSRTPRREQRRLDVVVRADRDAARRDDHVGVSDRCRERRLGRIAVVAHHRGASQPPPPPAAPGRRSRWRSTRRSGPARAEARRHQLAAGGEHRDPRPVARPRRSISAGGRDRGQQGRRQPSPARATRLAGGDVLRRPAGCRHPALSARPPGRRRSSASSIGTIASAPSGSGAPVAMPAALPAGSTRRPVAGGDAKCDRQRLAAELGRPHRVAVHRRGGERRQVDGGHHVGGQHAAGQPGSIGWREAPIGGAWSRISSSARSTESRETVAMSGGGGPPLPPPPPLPLPLPLPPPSTCRRRSTAAAAGRPGSRRWWHGCAQLGPVVG